MRFCGLFLNEGTFIVEFFDFDPNTFQARLDFGELDLPSLIQIQQALFFSLALFAFLAFFRQYRGGVTLLPLFFLGAARVFLQDEVGIF